MTGQGKTSKTTPPSIGATAGPTAISIAMRDKALAARLGPNISRVTVRASVGPTQAPTPCKNRKTNNSSTVVDCAQPMQAATKISVPPVSTGLRPKRSASGPQAR